MAKLGKKYNVTAESEELNVLIYNSSGNRQWYEDFYFLLGQDFNISMGYSNDDLNLMGLKKGKNLLALQREDAEGKFLKFVGCQDSRSPIFY